MQLSAHFISNSNLQRRERAGETGRLRGRRGRAGMFNVNFYGTTAWQRERRKEEGGQKEGERASSATKSGFITKAAGHCRFMAAAAADVCPLLPCAAPVRVHPAASRSIARSVALWFIIPLSRFNLRTLSQQCRRRRRRESQHNRLLSLSSLCSASLPGK